MKRTIGLKAVALISVLSLVNQTFTLVDSTTDNQLPNMREEWQIPEPRVCRYDYMGEMDVESNADTTGNTVKSSGYQGKQSDIEEMESGGDPELGW
jgi:hypothetical protein